MSRARHFNADAVPARPRRRRSWKQRTLITLGCLVAVVSVAGASLAGYTLIKFAGIDRYEDLEIDQAPAGEPENYLLVGSDVRTDGSVGGRRSDTIMVVRIDPREEAAAVLSLPRDLIVPLAGSGEEGRINTAYASGTPEEGSQRLIDTIRENFQIDIHHYVEIDFAGFARLVDAVGGVPLYFDAAVRDRGSGLYQENLGCVTLNGEQALTFVRARHLEYMTPDGEWQNDPRSDLSRIERQQFFIREAVSRTLGQVTNPTKILQFIDIATDTVTIDGELGRSDMTDLADRFRDFDPARLQTYPLPVVDNDDQATVSVNEREAEPVLNVFRGLDPGEITPGLIEVTVLNGTGVQNQAADVADALDRVGFSVLETGDAPDPRPWARTTVYHAPGEEAYGQRLARHVTGGADVQPQPSLQQGSVQLITGTDFTTIHEQPTPTTTTTAPAAVGAAGSGETASTAPPATTTTTTAPPATTTSSTVTPVRTPPPGADCG